MLDYISFNIKDVEKDCISFYHIPDLLTQFNPYTGEIPTKGNNIQELTAKYKDIKIVLHTDQNKVIKTSFKGSIHKYHCNGVNHTDFTFNDLTEAINGFSNEFGVSPDNLKIASFEFAVNILLPISCSEFLNNLISYKGIAPNKERFNGTGLSIIFKLSNYWVRIYDKGLQSKLTDFNNLLRYEIKVRKMDFINQRKNIEIKTLADLLNFDNFKQLQNILLESLDHLIYYDSTINLKTIKNEKEKLFLIEANNPRYWEKLKYDGKEKQYKRNLNKFEDKVHLYSQRNIKNDLKNIVQNKLNELSKNVHLLPVTQKTEKSVYYPYISSNNSTTDRTYCIVTGIDITHQKGGSRFVSENTLKTLWKTEPVKYYFLHRKYGKKLRDTDFYNLAHRIRNVDSSIYHSLSKRLVRSLSQTTLFNAEEVLCLTPTQWSIIYNYQNKKKG